MRDWGRIVREESWTGEEGGNKQEGVERLYKGRKDERERNREREESVEKKK